MRIKDQPQQKAIPTLGLMKHGEGSYCQNPARYTATVQEIADRSGSLCNEAQPLQN